jgi:hypothetical protein
VGTIVPFSLMFAGDKRPLRKLLLDQKATIRLISCDNNPDAIFEAPGSERNRQRTTIIQVTGCETGLSVLTTDFLRWSRQERPQVFQKLRFADVSSLAAEDHFPAISDERLVSFWQRLSAAPRTLYGLASDIISESRRPQDDEIYITVPRAAGYFISASPGPLKRNKVLSLVFENRANMNLARILINSNVFYWYWRAFGDGFLLGVDFVGSFPAPYPADDRYTELAAALDSVMASCTTYQSRLGESIPNYNFNRRMDILLQIDDWIVGQVGPDLNLPRDIFAQYKSNSFLHPLDLRVLVAESDDTAGDE